MSQKSSSMQIAEQLSDMSSRFKTPSHERGVCNSAIEELRRLHAENEALKLQLLKATTPPVTERAWAEYCLAHRTVDATDQVGEKVRGACNGVAP